MRAYYGRSVLAAFVVFAAISGTGWAADSYKISGADVTVVCPLTVGGSFEARTKSVTGEVAPSNQRGTVAGAVKIDLKTLETGISLRDRHMRSNYLEVEKGPQFAVATFDNIRLEKLDGKTNFSGTLMLHGQRKKVSGVADVQQRGGHLRVQAQFPIRVSEFRIPAPTYLGVGVRDEIQVKVTLTAVPSAVARTASANGTVARSR
jgi:polyisoprenoid-binding protein YceI